MLKGTPRRSEARVPTSWPTRVILKAAFLISSAQVPRAHLRAVPKEAGAHRFGHQTVSLHLPGLSFDVLPSKNGFVQQEIQLPREDAEDPHPLVFIDVIFNLLGLPPLRIELIDERLALLHIIFVRGCSGAGVGRAAKV